MRDPGATAAIGLCLLLVAFGATIDVPKAAGNFKGDEATYYTLAHSLARDFDFKFDFRDLHRVWEEFPAGPEGIFLKKAKTNRLTRASAFPYVRRVKLEEERVATRLDYAKSFIYPLAAAPFVFLFGTHGFLIFHALLLSLDLWLAYLFLRARGSPPGVAVCYAAAFLFASVVPVYFVWFTPELFNVTLAFAAIFLWCYKEVAVDRVGAPRFLFGPASDYAAAALVGVLTFSKLPHAILMMPLVLLAATRLQWRRAIVTAAVWGIVAGGLFTSNLAISGEFNYQAGDRKTFYGHSGFPFANTRETFENLGPVRERGSVMVGDVLVNKHTLTVFRHNVGYFLFGRFSGLLPYFFPGVLCAALFAVCGRRHLWQWLVGGTIVAAAVVFIAWTPFTWSGGGGPIGNRYFLSFYPLFLFLTPPLAGFGVPAIALAAGSLFTAQLLLNPIGASMRPGDHTGSAPLRWLPVELTLLHDLPMAFNPTRSRVAYPPRPPAGGPPPLLLYFPDDNAYTPEGDRIWVKGKSGTQIVLRAPVVDLGGGRFVTKTIVRLAIEVTNGGDPARVRVSTGAQSKTMNLKSAETVSFTLDMPEGVPYHRDENPTSYLYVLAVSTNAGFVPFLDDPNAPGDSRFLGVQIRAVPEFGDAETTTWTPAVEQP